MQKISQSTQTDLYNPYTKHSTSLHYKRDNSISNFKASSTYIKNIMHKPPANPYSTCITSTTQPTPLTQLQTIIHSIHIQIHASIPIAATQSIHIIKMNLIFFRNLYMFHQKTHRPCHACPAPKSASAGRATNVSNKHEPDDIPREPQPKPPAIRHSSPAATPSTLFTSSCSAPWSPWRRWGPSSRRP